MFLKSSKATHQSSDQELISRFQQHGDGEALATLFERYTHLIFGVCLKYLQDTEESKDATLQLYDHLRNKLPGESIHNFSAWLHQVTKNHCLMHLRQQNRRRNHHAKYEQEQLMENAQPEHLTDQTQQLEWKEQQLLQALQQLPDGQKECLTLFYLEDKTYQEVAEITHSSVKQVKSHIQNGKRKLKILLGKLYLILFIIKLLQ